MLAPTVNTDYMNHHLRFISEQVGADVHVILVLDQAGWHVSKALNVPDNISLLYLPPYSPELNPVERLWAYLRSHYLSNTVHCDYDRLLLAGRNAWNEITTSQFSTICATSWIVHEN